MIIIKKENENDISNFHVHDLEFSNFTYNHDNQSLRLHLNKIAIDFKQIMFINFTCIEFWAPGCNVNSWNIFDTKNIINELLDRAKKETKNWLVISKFSEPQDNNIGIVITINSGDQLKIICKEININVESN